MNRRILIVISLVAAGCGAGRASAAYLSVVSTTGTGLIYHRLNAPGSPTQVEQLTFSDTHQVPSIVSASDGDVVDINGLVNESAAGHSSAQIGALKATISCELMTTSSSNAPAYLTNGTFDATSIADWTDSATVAGLTPGKSVFVNGVLQISGTLAESLDSIGVNSGSGFATMNLSGTGIVFVSGGFGERTSPPTHLNNPPPNLVPLVIQMTVGAPHEIKYTLSVRAVGDLQSNLYSPAALNSNATLKVSGDFGSTVTWGGITSLTDAVTGATLTGWSVQSDSGFDYSRPFPIPEPATLILLGLGVFSLTVAARKRA